MYEAPCPQCGSPLGLDETSTNRKLICPICGQKIAVPKYRRRDTASWQAVFAWNLGFLCVAMIGCSIWLGIAWGTFVVVACGVVILSSPMAVRLLRQGIDQLERIRLSKVSGKVEQPLIFRSRRRLEDSSKSLTTGMIPQAPAGLSRPPSTRDELVEIRTTTIEPRSDRGNAAAVAAPIRNDRREDYPATVSGSKIQFFGAGEVITFDRSELRSPLVYAVSGVLDVSPEPSLIEFGLPVGRVGIRPAQDPGNWPAYRAFNSAQRAFYLDWIAAGRRLPTMPHAYVALYVQGLERRILVDGEDHQAIATELVGLIQTYGQVYAFRHDLACFLWFTLQLSLDAQRVSNQTIEAAVQLTSEWNDSLVRYCLTTYALFRLPVAPELARKLTAIHPQATASVVHQRHEQKFATLFDQRVREAFPAGLLFEVSGRAERLDYVFLNPTLARLPRAETRTTARQRVPDDSPATQTLLELWTRCTHELKTYDRAHRAAGSGQLTTEMWEALPEISRQEDHPEVEAWSKLIQQACQVHGRPLISISGLAAIKNFEPRGRLTKKQTEQLLTTAGHLGLVLEPDARMLGRNYAWDEIVAIFPRRDPLPENTADYHAATVLLRLGMSIAAADGQIDETEVQRISSHLSQQFQLTPTSAERLEQLRHVYGQTPNSISTLARSLQEKLPLDQREVVGEFLVGIAVADGSITKDEQKALKKAWQALGLNPESLNRLIQVPERPVAETTGSTIPAIPEAIVLDQNRIAQIMRDTQRVAEILRAAMQESEGESEGTDTESVAVPAEQISHDQPGLEENNALAIVESGDSAQLIEAAPINSVVVPIAQIRPGNADPISPNARLEGRGGDATQTAASPIGAGLPNRYHPFLNQLLTQSVWSAKTLDQLARSQGLMLSGALEAINAWTYETYEDWLMSEVGDEIHVQLELLTPAGRGNASSTG